MSARARRLAALEARLLPGITPEVRALAERLAAALDGDRYTADEMLVEVVAVYRAIGEPFTVARYAAYVARRDGVAMESVLAEARALAARYQ